MIGDLRFLTPWWRGIFWCFLLFGILPDGLGRVWMLLLLGEEVTIWRKMRIDQYGRFTASYLLMCSPSEDCAFLRANTTCALNAASTVNVTRLFSL
jgi:hypothetical protein